MNTTDRNNLVRTTLCKLGYPTELTNPELEAIFFDAFSDTLIQTQEILTAFTREFVDPNYPGCLLLQEDQTLADQVQDIYNRLPLNLGNNPELETLRQENQRLKDMLSASSDEQLRLLREADKARGYITSLELVLEALRALYDELTQ